MRPLKEDELKRIYNNLTFLVDKLIDGQNLQNLLAGCKFLSEEQKNYVLERGTIRNKAITLFDIVSRFSYYKFLLFITTLNAIDLKDISTILRGFHGNDILFYFAKN